MMCHQSGWYTDDNGKPFHVHGENMSNETMSAVKRLVEATHEMMEAKELRERVAFLEKALRAIYDSRQAEWLEAHGVNMSRFDGTPEDILERSRNVEVAEIALYWHERQSASKAWESLWNVVDKAAPALTQADANAAATE